MIVEDSLHMRLYVAKPPGVLVSPSERSLSFIIALVMMRTIVGVRVGGGGWAGREAAARNVEKICLRLSLTLQGRTRNSPKVVFYSGAKTGNEIQLEIRMSSTITMSKRKLKEFLQN